MSMDFDHCGICIWSGSGRGRFILDLRSVHKPVMRWVKIAAHVKRITIIPNHDILAAIVAPNDVVHF